jgi:hypothetical protein
VTTMGYLSVPKRAGNGATRSGIGVADAPRYRRAMPNLCCSIQAGLT